MATYLMLGKYTTQSLKNASPQRTRRVQQIVARFGGRPRTIMALLGPFDLLIIADFPSNEVAMEAVVAVSRDTGIGFTTCPAVSVEQFDRMLKES